MTPARLGGAAWLLCSQFFVAEAVTAAGFRGGYSYRFGYISDLGAKFCLDVCSARHALMNGSFALQGALIGAGLSLGALTIGSGRVEQAGKLALAVCALGVFVVGAAPEDFAPGWHYAGAAANLVGCNLAALLIGLGRGAAGAPARRLGVVAGGVGLAACVALGLGVDGGLGVGTIERLASYPFLLWLIALGASFTRWRHATVPTSW